MLLRLLLLSSLTLAASGCSSRTYPDAVVLYKTEWCGTCTAQVPAFKAWGQANGVTVIVEDVTDEPRTVLRQHIHQYPTYIYYRDGKEEYRAYNVSSLYVPE